MATVTVKNLKIAKEADRGNELCFVSFSYSVECDPTEQILSKQGLLKFEIKASLLGYDDWFDDHLSDMPSGTNHYQCGDGQINIGPVAIPCSVLDEDVGEDEIYLKVTATSVGVPGGKEYAAEGSSNTITWKV